MQINSSHAPSESTASTASSRFVEPSLPWYRYGMVWMVIALPFIVVVASMVTMSIAFKNAPQVIQVKADNSTVNNKTIDEPAVSPIQAEGD